MDYETIRFEIASGVGRLTLNRADKLNCFTARMHEELRDALGRAQRDTRALLITGAGRAFCAGQDLDERAGMTPGSFDAGAAIERTYNPLIKTLRGLDQP